MPTNFRPTRSARLLYGGTLPTTVTRSNVERGRLKKNWQRFDLIFTREREIAYRRRRVIGNVRVSRIIIIIILLLRARRQYLITAVRVL